MFANTLIHTGFDTRNLVVLKVCHFPYIFILSLTYPASNTQTPNKILGTEDVPPRHDRRVPASVQYPADSRYTLQWLIPPSKYVASIPNNSDATFKKRTAKPKPSELLLHYNYGAAAVKQWGQGKEVLLNRAEPPRSVVPVPAPAGSSKTIHDRSIAIQKREAALAAATLKAETQGLVKSEGQEVWDEDDVMLFFWGNSRAAKERYLKKTHENTQRMEQWRAAVPQFSA